MGTKNVHTGVSQWSILGPLVFIVYINDNFDLTNSAKFITLANNMSIFVSRNNPDDIVKSADNIVLSLKSWVDSNQLIINPTKKAAFFQSLNKLIISSVDLSW